MRGCKHNLHVYDGATVYAPHETTIPVDPLGFGPGYANAPGQHRCGSCWEVLPLGPSDETDPRIAVEIRAAEIAADGEPSTNTRDGLLIREGAGWHAAALGFDADWCTGDADCLAGFLANRITSHAIHRRRRT